MKALYEKTENLETEVVKNYSFYINHDNEAKMQRLRETIEAKIANQQQELNTLIESRNIIERLHSTFYKAKTDARLGSFLENFLIKHADEFSAAIDKTMTQLNMAINIESKINLEFKEYPIY